MDGEWLGSRAIRCNWANQKGQPSIAQQATMQQMGMTPTTPFGHHHFPTHGVHSYDMIVSQTPEWQTTCYVGNLTPYTTQNDLVPLFQNFGYVVESRFQADRGFAFIKMDTHSNAAMAICQLNGYNVNGRPLKCSVSVAPSPLFLIAYPGVGLLTTCSGARTRARAAMLVVPSIPTRPSTALRVLVVLLILQRLRSTSLSMVVCGHPCIESSRTVRNANNAFAGQYAGQQGNYAAPQAQSPAGYGAQAMGYGGPPSAGGYGHGRGQQGQNAQWAQNTPPQNFNNGFGGYQG
jgi:nucleolysin TIA-1/TIAR